MNVTTTVKHLIQLSANTFGVNATGTKTVADPGFANGGTMTSMQSASLNGGPQRGPGAEPLVGGQGA